MNAPSLFIVPTAGRVKEAGFRLPSDPSLWQAEVIQHLASTHPYLPLDRVEVNFKKIDARKGAAVGAVLVGDKVAIPLIIQRPGPSKDPELEPLDVFYHEGRYRFLDPDMIRSVIMQPEIGEPARRPLGGANYPGRNDHYIGDLTGDRSPLEHSYFGGGGAKMAALAGDDDDLSGWLEKTAKDPKKLTPAERSAVSFGVAGGGGGTLRGAAKGAGQPGTIKNKAVRAVVEAAKGGALGTTVGGVGGAVSAKALERIGIDRAKLTPEQRKQVHNIASRKVEKTAYLGRPLPKRPQYRDAPAHDVATNQTGVILADAVNPKSESATRQGFSSTHEHEHLQSESRSLLRMLRTEGQLDPNDLANFRALLAHNPTLLLAARNNLAVLDNVTSPLPEKERVPRQPVAGPRVLQVFKTESGVKIKFSGRKPETIDNGTLKQLLGDKYSGAMQKVDEGQVYVLADEINPTTWSIDRVPKSAVPVDRDGMWLLRSPNGEATPAFVAKSVMSPDGVTVPLKMAVTRDGKYSLGKEMFGVRIADKNRITGATKAKSGDEGIFVHYLQGTPTVTVPMRVDSTSTLEDEKGDHRTVYKVTDTITGKKCAIIPAKDIYGIMPITWPEPDTKVLIGDLPAYAIPASSEWIKTTGQFDVVEHGELATKTASVEGRITIREKDGLFSMDGMFQKEAIFGMLASAAKHLPKAGAALKTVAKNPRATAKNVKDTFAYGKGADTGLKGVGAGLAQVGQTYAPALAGAGAIGGLGLAGYGGYKAVTAAYAGDGVSDFAEVEWRNIGTHDALEALVAAGIDAGDAASIIKTARDRTMLDDPLTVVGVNMPFIVDEDEMEKIANAEVEYGDDFVDFVAGLRPGLGLIKSAAESEHPETLDAVLSLEFITPQNARYFFESTDQFEEVASKLAALLVAVRLGLQHVPKASVRDALEGLSRTISRLKVLKSAMEESNRPDG
jgi:hypothetical protein